MSMKRRLAARFIIQLVVAGLIALLAAALCTIWILDRFADINVSKNFAEAGLEQLVESSELGEDGIKFAPSLLEQVKKKGGWLQTLDETGQVAFSYNAPADVPKHYAPGELMDYWYKRKDFPYDLMLWIREKNDRKYTVLYGFQDDYYQLLKQTVKEGHLSDDGQLLLPQKVKSRVTALNGYIQLINAQGEELASYNKPDHAASHYSFQDLALRTVYNERYGYHLMSNYITETGQTWVILFPNYSGGSDGKQALIPDEARTLIIGIGSMVVVLIMMLVLLSLWHAHRFMAPVLHMLRWLNFLGKGTYAEPVNRSGIAYSRKRSGGWRSRYKIFSEVLESIQGLSVKLQEDQELRSQNRQLREEWITGITHDLKTPLSSIKGYAHMLAEPEYEWSPEEVRHFSQIMLDKSTHMDTLINDLGLTYRLNAGVQPPQGELIELNTWLARTLELLATNPAFGKDRIVFCPAAAPLHVILHPPWLERVVSNLVANAMLHNPPQTVLTVSAMLQPHRERETELVLAFSDNGSGMNEQTAEKLFDRYFRGSDTSTTTEGSGLGMAISKGLVEAMHGEITLETSPGKGTTIRLSWPLRLIQDALTISELK